jgi:hypothetical protein
MLGFGLRRGLLLGSRHTPWYLAGGVPLANCLGAYQPVGAANIGASYTNIAHPGTGTDAEPVQFKEPTWNVSDGWIADGTKVARLPAAWVYGATTSIICRFTGVGAPFEDDNLFGSQTPYAAPIHRSATELFFGIGGKYLLPTFTSTASGVVALCGPYGYYNKANSGPVVAPDFTGTDRIFVFGKTATSGLIAAKIQALAIYNITLSLAQVNAITDAMAALPPALPI